MKTTFNSIPLLLLALSFSFPISAANSELQGAEPLPAPPTNTPSGPAAALSLAKPVVGTKNAPVDGQDGMPHSGPYVAEPPKQDVLDSKGSAGADVDPNSRPRPAPGSLAEEAWKMGPENDGVMLDRGKGPKDGPRGTEGGVSEKSKDRKAQEEQSGGPVGKKPDPPKEAPPLPASEQLGKKPGEKGREGGEKPDKPKGAVGLEKPTDLPDKPHAIPHPEPPSLSKSGGMYSLPHFSGTFDSIPVPGADVPAYRSFFLSLVMIIFSEIGDKTFLVAALMAMRHPRMVVFSAACSALIGMTVLSAVLGHALPALLSKRLTTGLASLLFFVFGIRLLREGLSMDPNEGVGAEMKEVEQELNEKEQLHFRSDRVTGSNQTSISPYALEAGTAGARHRDSSRNPSKSASKSLSPSRSGAKRSRLSGLNNLCGLLLSPAWVQTFVMTFLGEWGDRSQIATVAMAAGDDLWWVTGGAVIGHCLCTGAAVLGGRAIAGKVSLRVVTLGGAIAFLIFGFVYLLDVVHSS